MAGITQKELSSLIFIVVLFEENNIRSRSNYNLELGQRF